MRELAARLHRRGGRHLGWLLKYPGTFQGDGVEPVEGAYERYRSRWDSVASTNESILSVLQAKGARP